MLERYYRMSGATGISITTQQDGTIEINACSIAIENNQLNFEKKITDTYEIESLTKHFPAKTVIALNLSGKGILQKQTDRVEEINQDNFSKILPNANMGDFYIQNFLSGDQSFISVIRKSEADKWIHQITDMGFIPLTLSLGPFPVKNIIGQVNVYGDEVIFNGHTVLRNKLMDWTSVSYNAWELARSP